MSEEFYISEEMMEWVALKKSEYLSVLIQNHHGDDIPIEEYHEFNHMVEGTISKADRSFLQEIDGHKLHTYLRTYDQGTQVAIGAVFADPKTNSEIFVPVLSFMSRNNDLIGIFSVGSPLRTPPTLS